MKSGPHKSICQGAEIFSVENDYCNGRGYYISKPDAVEAISGRVSHRHHSVDQLDELKKELAALAATGFDSEEIEATLTSFAGLEPWRIGETFAECWLEEHRQCFFPWNTSQDVRSLKASLPGTDLIGMTRLGGSIAFAFGEVKCSSDSCTPPSVVYGNKGVAFQIKHLYQSAMQRRQLVQNLGLRAFGKTWFEEYKFAFSAHMQNSYCYWGILIRDTKPSQKDVEYCVTTLISWADNKRPAEFLAIYTQLQLADWPQYCGGGGVQ